MTNTISALVLAKHILARMEDREFKVNNQKLQKLLYYMQAWYLALYDKPVFYEDIEAWAMGPVVPVVFKHYEYWGYMGIRNVQTKDSDLAPELSTHLEKVLGVYGSYSGFDLSMMIRREQEGPWTVAWNGVKNRGETSRVIGHDEMREYYFNAMHLTLKIDMEEQIAKVERYRDMWECKSQ